MHVFETVGCIYVDVGCIYAKAAGCIYADVGCISMERLGASLEPVFLSKNEISVSFQILSMHASRDFIPEFHLLMLNLPSCWPGMPNLPLPARIAVFEIRCASNLRPDRFISFILSMHASKNDKFHLSPSMHAQ